MVVTPRWYIWFYFRYIRCHINLITHTYIYTYIHIDIYIYTYIHTFIHIYIYTHIHIYIHMGQGKGVRIELYGTYWDISAECNISSGGRCKISGWQHIRGRGRGGVWPNRDGMLSISGGMSNQCNHVSQKSPCVNPPQNFSSDVSLPCCPGLNLC